MVNANETSLQFPYISKKCIKILVSFVELFICISSLRLHILLQFLMVSPTVQHIIIFCLLLQPWVIRRSIDCFLTPNHGVPGILSMIINIFLVIKLDKLPICHTKKWVHIKRWDSFVARLLIRHCIAKKNHPSRLGHIRQFKIPMQSKEMLLSFNRGKLLMWLNANEGFTTDVSWSRVRTQDL